jgi:hypothetical protein
MKAARRTLTFASLEDIPRDVDRLLAGHATVGNWTLGQICNHLTTALTGSLDGFAGRVPWLVRKTVGPLILRRILRRGRFPRGVRLPKTFEPQPGCDARAEAEALRAAVKRLAAHAGPVADHPLAEKVSNEVWERFHRIHCAYHLSYALPTAGNGSR